MVRTAFAAGFVFAAALAAPLATASAAQLPNIQLSSSNQVPACVTPARLMDFTKARNPNVAAVFADVPDYYQKHGEAVGVRWDMAYYQMLIETNWLTYKKPSGRPSDVHPSQNNFAGIGATGGGVPGERFADVSTGVLAHLQHIKMYSGVRQPSPTAARTRKVQDWIIPWSNSLGRDVTFTDLTTKWSPTDRGYSNDIDSVANRFIRNHCPEGVNWRPEPQVTETQTTTAQAPAFDTSTRSGLTTSGTDLSEALQPPAPGTACRVWSAAFENARTAVLIRSNDQRTVNYTALGVSPDIAQAQADAYMSRHAKDGQLIGNFDDTDAALNKAFELCPKA